MNKLNKWIVAACIMIASVVMSGCAALDVGGSAGAGDILAPDAYAQNWQGSQEHLLLDVRTPGEYQSGHIAGAVNIPLSQIDQHLSELPQDTPVVLYCRSGNRSGQAANILSKAGYNNIYDLGGTIQWTNAGYPLQR